MPALTVGLVLAAATPADAATCIGFHDGRTAAAMEDTDNDTVDDSRDTCVGVLAGSTGHDDAGCPAGFSPYTDVSFDHAKHESWYRRFWTGSCDGLGFFDFCLENGQFWDAFSAETLDRVPPDARPLLQAQLWSAGRYIGHEWARDNDIRRIDTRQLSAWYEFVGDATDPPAALQTICHEAEALMATD